MAVILGSEVVVEVEGEAGGAGEGSQIGTGDSCSEKESLL